MLGQPVRRDVGRHRRSVETACEQITGYVGRIDRVHVHPLMIDASVSKTSLRCIQRPTMEGGGKTTDIAAAISPGR